MESHGRHGAGLVSFSFPSEAEKRDKSNGKHDGYEANHKGYSEFKDSERGSEVFLCGKVFHVRS